MTNFLVYLIGVALVAAAVGYGASLWGLSQQWVVVIVMALLGIGVMGGIVKTRHKD